MVRRFCNDWVQRKLRRRRSVALRDIRRQLESCGYSMSEISDSDLEAAVTYGGRRIEKSMPLTAKRTFWILRRLSSDVTPLRRRARSSGNSMNIGNYRGGI